MDCNYTQIKNTVLEQLAETDLSPAQFRLVLVICRLTYGYHRKEAAISTGAFQERTQLDARNIRRRIKELVDRRIVYQIVESTRTRIIGINERFAEWIATEGRGALSVEKSGEGQGAPSAEGQADLSISEAEGQVALKTTGQPAPPLNKERKKTFKENEKKDEAGPDMLQQADEIEFYFCSKKGKLPPSSLTDMEAIKRVLANQVPVPFLKGVIDKAFTEFKPAYVGDKIHTFSYIEPLAMKSWVHQQQRSKPVEGVRAGAGISELQGYRRRSPGEAGSGASGAIFPTESKWDRAERESAGV